MVLLNAVKEQQEQIVRLAEELRALRQQLDVLEAGAPGRREAANRPAAR